MNDHPLVHLISQYLADKDIRKESFDLYQTILKQYISYLKDKHILYPKTSDVKNYITWKKTQGYSVRWIYHQISTVKGLYQYLSLNQKRLSLPELFANDIIEAMINERIKRKLSKPILNAQEAKQIILKTKEKRKYIWHYRDHAMIYLMITTGLRSV
ncbi:MAG: site-specific integrase [Candidatus Izemoplasmataceae bacterium]